MENGTNARKFLRRIKVTFPTSLFPAFPLFPIRYKRRKGGGRRRPYWPRKGGGGKSFFLAVRYTSSSSNFRQIWRRQRAHFRDLPPLAPFLYLFLRLPPPLSLPLLFSIQDVWRRRRRRTGKWYQERRGRGRSILYTAL